MSDDNYSDNFGDPSYRPMHENMGLRQAFEDFDQSSDHPSGDYPRLGANSPLASIATVVLLVAFLAAIFLG